MRIGNRIAVNYPIGPERPAFARSFISGIGEGFLPNYSSRDEASQRLKLTTDVLHLSYQAKQRQFNLHISGNDAANKPIVSWEEQIKSSRADPKLKLMDKHLTKAGKLLEEMKKLAKLAQDEMLSDEYRIAIQMEMGDLQHELDCETELFCSAYQTGESKIVLHEPQYKDTDSYKMLQRAAERLANGEEWNVAEVLVPVGSSKGIEGYGWQVTDDPNAPTVDDILKAKGRSVMDSNAAKISTFELEDDISELLKLRDRFAAFIGKNGVRSQEANTEDSSFSKMREVFFTKMMDFLNIIARDPVEYSVLECEEKNEMLSSFDPPEEYSIAQKSVEDTSLWATVADSQLRSKLSINVQISLNVEITANARTKMVLRHDPSRDVPYSLVKWVKAVEITDQDPEFYKRTPRVYDMRNENGDLLVEYAKRREDSPHRPGADSQSSLWPDIYG
ncbi:MAG: hypothetical protein LBI74_10350 [Synergistaceae bacterium]|nr:hypothetical protein [Synergistaceae bacterium]